MAVNNGSILGEETIVTAIDSNYQYYGYATPGTATTAPAWKVYRVAIAAPVSATTVPLKQYANGNSNYTNAANAMTTLTGWA